MSGTGGSNERPPESADFAAARVGDPRRRPPFAVLGWVVVLGGVVAVGLSGHMGGAAGGPESSATAATAAAATDHLPSSSFRVVEGSRSPRFDPDFPSLPRADGAETSPPGPIGLEATRNASSVYVHGDVFARQVTWVFVSLQTLDGQVGGWASVSIPGAADAGRNAGPALRFDVELAVPTTMATGVLMVQANAYNVEGALIASTRLRLAPEM